MNGIAIMYENYFKRLLDIILSINALFFLSPLLLIVFFIVKTDSKGPFLFKQIRIGKNLKKFTIYKVRTMSEKAGIDANNEKLEYITTSVNDPRITKPGIKLRKYHIDEIPQFFNVLKGDMSIIGPRPDAPSQEKDYSQDFWIQRHSIRPGITGLSQIKSSFFNSQKRRNKYDFFYSICKHKLKLDVYIYIETFLKIKRGSSF
jgi:lipopolysaccharide/colanic/teichoic acid biosynthesis glycosyltransferase